MVPFHLMPTMLLGWLEREQREVSRVVRVAAIAIERRQIDDRALALAERIEAIREDERTNVAHELQGELGQLLAVLKLDVSWLARRVAGDPEVAGKFEEMNLLADAMIASLSRISTPCARPSSISWD